MKIEQKPKIILDSEDLFALNKAQNILEQLCDREIIIGNEVTSEINCFNAIYDEDEFAKAMDVIGVVLQVAEDKEEKKTTDPFTEKKLKTFDEMIDTRCDVYGVASTLDYLIEQGYSKEELFSMRFDMKDIKEAFERAKEN